jgi:hypothetical protein
MNPEIKAKWIAALRSGKYKQGQDGLKSGDRFCCLGVLCEVMGIPEEHDEYEGEDAFLPISARDAAGIDSDGTLPVEVEFKDSDRYSLVDLNDAGADFNFIADVIEKQL